MKQLDLVQYVQKNYKSLETVNITDSDIYNFFDRIHGMSYEIEFLESYDCGVEIKYIYHMFTGKDTSEQKAYFNDGKLASIEVVDGQLYDMLTVDEFQFKCMIDKFMVYVIMEKRLESCVKHINICEDINQSVSVWIHENDLYYYTKYIDLFEYRYTTTTLAYIHNDELYIIQEVISLTNDIVKIKLESGEIMDAHFSKILFKSNK